MTTPRHLRRWTARYTIYALYWLSLVVGIAVSLSGLLLLFLFYKTNIANMQLAQVVHAVVAISCVADC